MKQIPHDEHIIDEALKNVPQDVWDIVDLVHHCVRQKDETQFEIELAQIGQAIRNLAMGLERGAEPFWMQDIRLATKRIEAERLASRARSRPDHSGGESGEL